MQRLHALDLATGAEKFGGPVVIQASVPGTGNGSVGGSVPFDPLRENQRTALLLNNGVIYMGFGSHGDNQPYHGWLLGYNATTLQRVLVFNSHSERRRRRHLAERTAASRSIEPATSTSSQATAHSTRTPAVSTTATAS